MCSLQQGISFDFCCPQCCGGIGGEKRVSGTGGKDNDTPLLEVANRSTTNVSLSDSRHLDRRLHTSWLPLALKRVLKGQRVHHCAQHADVIALSGVHAFHCAGAAAPEISATNDDCDINTKVLPKVNNLSGSRIEGRAVKSATRWSSECLT